MQELGTAMLYIGAIGIICLYAVLVGIWIWKKDRENIKAVVMERLEERRGYYSAKRRDKETESEKVRTAESRA